MDNNHTFAGVGPAYNGNVPPFRGSNDPTFNGSPPPAFNGNLPPTYNGNTPPFNQPPLEGNVPSFSGNIPPVFNGNEPEFAEDGLSFNHIGPSISDVSPMSRIKRQIAFPHDDEDEALEDKILENKIEEVGGEENSVQVFDAADGRASKQTIQSVTKIDVGVQSQLLVAPGATSIIYFDVTNLRNEPSYHSFSVQDEKRYLRAMEPRM